MADRWYTILDLIYLALAVLIPVVAYRALARPLRQRARAEAMPKRWRGVAGWASAVVSALTISPLLLVMAVCTGPRPGESDAAHATKIGAQPLIIALDEHRLRHGSYPASLTDLRSDSAARPLASTARETYPLQYRLDSLGFELHFEYSGPAMNECRYRSSVGTWRCWGYW